MLMLTLQESGIRRLMNALLTSDVFDMYELRGCVIQSFARFDIEGVVPQASGKGDEGGTHKNRFIKWERLRPYVYNIIKGNEKPRFLKIIFACPEGLLSEFPNAAALFINIVLDDGKVHISTGASAKTWSPEKSCEEKWDLYAMKFLRENKLIPKEQEQSNGQNQ